MPERNNNRVDFNNHIHLTYARGEEVRTAKITEDVAVALRTLRKHGHTFRKGDPTLETLGISASNANKIGRGDTWKHLEGKTDDNRK